MNIYGTYVNKNLAYNMIVGAIILLNIGGTTQIIKLLYLINYGTGIFKFSYIVILALPSLLYSLLPFIGALSVIVFFMKQEATSKIMILKSCQMTSWDIVRPALITPVFCTLLAYYISVDLMPRAYTRLNSELHLIKTSFNQNILRSGEFIKISERVTLYIDEKQDDGELKNVMIFHDRDKFSEVIIAKSAIITLKDEILTLLLKNGRREVIGQGSRVRRASFARMAININTGDKFPDKRAKNPNSYFISEMLKMQQGEESSSQNLVTEGFNRLIWPLYNFLLPLLSVSIFMAVPVRKKFSLLKSVSIGIIAVVVSLAYFGLQNSIQFDLRLKSMLAASITIFMISGILFLLQGRNNRRLE